VPASACFRVSLVPASACFRVSLVPASEFLSLPAPPEWFWMIQCYTVLTACFCALKYMAHGFTALFSGFFLAPAFRRSVFRRAHLKSFKKDCHFIYRASNYLWRERLPSSKIILHAAGLLKDLNPSKI